MSRRSSARFSGSVEVTDVSQVLVPEYVSRIQLTITNNSAEDISLGLRVADGLMTVDPVAVPGDGIILKAGGGSWTTNEYTGPVAMVAGAVGPSSVAVTDI